MLVKSRMVYLVASISLIGLIIYIWALLTTEPEFVSDKCARNSGRVSSLINLAILLMMGHFGLKRIYMENEKYEPFRILATLFAFNHLIHFFFVYQNFKSHTMELSLTENLHGFLTFIAVLIVPLILWSVRRLNAVLHISLILHFFNVSYFIMETFYSKIKPEKPAYHNQLGIWVTSLAMLYVLFRAIREMTTKASVAQ